MLGTNDLKARFALTPADIAAAAELLLQRIEAAGAGPGGAPPRILLMSPVPIEEAGVLAGIFAGGAAKGRALAQRYRALAARRGVAFLDAGEHATASPVDGVHFDADQHARLATAVEQAIRAIG